MSRIRIKAHAKDGVVEVKSLFTHVMESGRRVDDETGEQVPAHYITEVFCEHNGRRVLTANWGPAVSRNPYFEFRFRGGAPGDVLRLGYVDNLGGKGEAEVEIR
jgi:sulfur-oxidizing protein SoxZ